MSAAADGGGSGSAWRPVRATVVVRYAFAGADASQLTVYPGEVVRVFEELQGWYRGIACASQKAGIVPQAYVAVLPAPASQWAALVDEIRSTMHLWSLRLRAAAATGALDRIEALTSLLRSLELLRTQLELESISDEQRKVMREDAVGIMERGNWILGLPLRPFSPAGEPADEMNVSISRLYKLFAAAVVRQQRVKSAGGAVPSAAGASPASSGAAGTAGASSLLCHLLVDVKACFLASFGSQLELVLSVFSVSSGEFVSEDCVVHVRGGVLDAGKGKVLFTNLEQKEFDTGLLVVFRCYRVGALEVDSDDEDGGAGHHGGARAQGYRRAVGSAVLNMGDPQCMQVLPTETEYFPDYLDLYGTRSDGLAAVVHESLARGDTRALEVLQGKAVAAGVRRYHGDLRVVVDENAALAQVTQCQRLTFGERIDPSESRHNVYVTLLDVSVPKAPVEFLCSVRNARGDVIPRAVQVGASSAPASELASATLLKTAGSLRERVHVCVPVEQLPSAHLFVKVLHARKNGSRDMYAFTALSLAKPGGLILGDGEYTLPLYKFQRGELPKPDQYLPSTAQPAPLKGSLRVHFRLVSTKATQNELLHSLLGWSKSNPKELAPALRQFTYVDPTERLKFLREIFAALFGILEKHGERELTAENVDKSMAMMVYSALVTLLGMFVDEKQGARLPQLQEILEVYIREHFQCAVAHIPLVVCMLSVLNYQGETQKLSQLVSTLRVLRYLVKFILTSRTQWEGGLHSGSGFDGRSSTEFQADILQVLERMVALSGSTEERLIAAQAMMLKQFAFVVDDLLGLLEDTTVADVSARLLQAFPAATDKRALLVEMLRLCAKLAQTRLMAEPSSRSIVMPVLLQHLASRMEDKTEASLAVQGFAALLETLQEKAPDAPDVVWALLQPTLTTLRRSMALAKAAAESSDLGLEVAGSAGDSEDRMMLSVAALTAIQLWRPQRFRGYVASLSSVGERAAFLTGILQYFDTMLRSMPFPDNFLSLRYCVFTKAVKMLHFLGDALLEWGSGARADAEHGDAVGALAALYFDGTVEALCYDVVASANYKHADEVQVFELQMRRRYGDLRCALARLLGHVWEAFRADLIAQTGVRVEQSVRLLLMPGADLRAAGFSVLKSMLMTIVAGGDESEVDDFLALLLGGIYKLYADGKLNASFDDYLLQSLLHMIKTTPDIPVLAVSFVHSVAEFLELTQRLSLAKGAVEDRLEGLLDLVQFVSGSRLSHMRPRFFSMMCDLHVSLGNQLEAGMALQLASSSLAWAPRATGVQRAELMRKAMDHFDKASQWERYLSVGGELLGYLRDIKMDYVAVAQTMRQMADRYEQIASRDRVFPYYYYVAFHGRGWSADLVGRAFVYKGKEGERNVEFEARLRQRFPAAKFIKNASTVKPEIVESEEQHLQIFSVQSSNPREPEDDAMDRSGAYAVPPRLAEFAANDNVTCFRVSAGVKRGKTGNDFADVWVRNVFFTVRDAFPSVRLRSEVIEQREEELHPVSAAVDAIQTKNAEIETLEGKFRPLRSCTAEQLNLLTMCLNGVIDAAVNGGVFKYQQAFFQNEFVSENRPLLGQLRQLQQLLDQQLAALDKALAVHRMLCPEELRPLQQKLDIFFGEMRKAVREKVVAFVIPSDGDTQGDVGPSGANGGAAASGTPSSVGAASTQ